MKKFTLILAVLFAGVFSSKNLNAQVNVSGGIYSNTTWTKANSPYIVTGDVVVFVNATLTIDAGVKVLFNDTTGLVINGNLIAKGNKNDSIIFTINPINSKLKYWDGIVIKKTTSDTSIYKYLVLTNSRFGFMVNNYSKISNSSFINNDSTIIQRYFYQIDSCYFYKNDNIQFFSYGSTHDKEMYKISNSKFINNNIYCYGIRENNTNGTIVNCDFGNNRFMSVEGGFNPPIQLSYLTSNCKFINNNFRRENTYLVYNISIEGNFKDCVFCGNTTLTFYSTTYSIYSIRNCIFTNSDTAITSNGFIFTNNMIYNNNIGLVLNPKISYQNSNDSIKNNIICNNSKYNIVNNYDPTKIIDLSNNCFCLPDSTSIANKILDGYDDIKLGLVRISPFNSCTSSVLPTKTYCTKIINDIDKIKTNNNSISIFPNPAKDKLIVTTEGKAEVKVFDIRGQLKYSRLFNENDVINLSNYSKGIYIIQITSDNKIYNSKFIKE